MSLQVWLPLNGNLNNQGISGVTVTNSGATVNDNGKIGKCYSFGGYLLGTQNFLSNSTPNWSYCCWVKFNSLSSWNCLFSDRTAVGTGGMAIFFSDTCAFDDGARWQFTPKTTIATNTWFHLCFVRDSSKGKFLYINGVLDSFTTELGTPSIVSDTNFAIGASQQSSTSVSGNQLNGLLNDVRIYDHALSPKEVKEISKALICHYPLDGSGKGGDNLCYNTNTASIDTNLFGYSEQTGGSTRTIEYDGGTPCVKITRNTTAHSGWDYLWYNSFLRNNVKPNTTYTVSFDVIGSGSSSIGFAGFLNGNGTNSMNASVTTIQNSFNSTSWSHIVFKTTTLSSFDSITVGSQVVYMSCVFLRTASTWIMMKNMKVEEGDINTPWCPNSADAAYTTLGYNSTTEIDTSGYKNNGTRNGNISLVNDTPRLNSATYFPAGSGIYSHPNISLSTYTFSFWGKHTDVGKMLMGNSDTATSTKRDWYWYGDNSFKYPSGEFYYNHNAGTAQELLNKWTHFVAVYDGSNITIYRNSINEGSKAATGSMLLDYLSVGIGFGNSGYWENGYISDFRLYATALSADDVKELYQSSASVTNNGSIMCYDFIEQ